MSVLILTSRSTARFTSRHSYRRRSKAEVLHLVSDELFRRMFGEGFRPSPASPAKTSTSPRFVLISSSPSCHPFRESMPVHYFPNLSFAFPVRSTMVARHRPPSTPSAQECRSRPLPAPCSSASRRWLLLGCVPCRPQPPHSVLPARPQLPSAPDPAWPDLINFNETSFVMKQQRFILRCLICKY